MAAVERFIELPTGVQLPYVEQGDPSGAAVILLHGIAGSWRSFGPVLPHLPDSLHVFALTQRGHGNASRPATGYRLRDFAADVNAFLAALGVEAAVLVGHSMGSAIAQRFVMDHPERSLGLVLVGAGVISGRNPRVQEFWETTLSRLADPIDPEFVRAFLGSTLAQPVPEAFFEEVMLQDALQVPARVWKEAFRARLEEDFSGDFHKIEVPTLLVWGDRDARCSLSEQEALLDAIEGARLAVYAGAGHELHCEEPERFASDLVAFVQRR